MSYRDERATTTTFILCHIARERMMTQQYKHRYMQGVALWWWNATIKSLYAVNRKDDNIKHIFDSYCKQDNKLFFVHISREQAYIHGTKVNCREDARDSCEGTAMMAHHTTIKSSTCCQLKWWRQTSSYCKKQWQQAYLQCFIAREAMTVVVLMLQEAVVLQGSEQHDNTITICKDATIKHYTCCWLQGWQRQALSTARMTATCIPYVVSQKKVTMNDGWLQRRGACQATTNQTLHCIAAGASKQWSRNKNIIDTMTMSYVVLQEATTLVTTTDCDKRTGLRKWQPTLFLDVD